MTRRDRLMILTVLAVGMLVGFWMLVLSPQRNAASEAQAAVQTARTALTNAQAKVTSGKAAQAAFRRDRATIVKIGRAVPESDDIPTLITQLESLAKKYDVYFVKYTIASGGAGSSAAASAPSASGSSAASSSTVAQAGAKGQNSSTNAIAPLYPPGSIEMTGGLGRTPITIGLRGRYFSLEKYLRAVQRFAVLSQNNERAKGRLMIVDGFSYKAGDLVFRSVNGSKRDTERWLEAELGASVYFAPPLEAPATSAAPSAAGAAPATPAAGDATSTPATGTATVGGLR